MQLFLRILKSIKNYTDLGLKFIQAPFEQKAFPENETYNQ